MSAADPKTYLWANIEALMGGGKQTVDAVQARTRASRGTIQRIKAAKTSVGIDLLIEIADSFGIEVWELLRPGLGKSEHGSESAGATKGPLNTGSAFALIEDLSLLLLPLDDADREQAEVLLRRLATQPEKSAQWAEKLSRLLGELHPSRPSTHKRAA